MIGRGTLATMEMTRKDTMMYSLRLRSIAVLHALVLAGDASTTANAGGEAQRLSFKCIYTRPFYVSFDLKTGGVVEETLSGELLRGKIDATVGDSIFFHIRKKGQSDFKYKMDMRAARLTSIRVPQEPNYGEQEFVCGVVELRKSLSRFDDL
ncbi:hypothetical protein BRAO285_1230065 [Bradyrhizobium sp. ORS 285]|nr:hypothetical protein BRAO285_1230065 [Bradyrhizobium sp. ORS 285]